MGLDWMGQRHLGEDQGATLNLQSPSGDLVEVSVTVTSGKGGSDDRVEGAVESTPAGGNTLHRGRREGDDGRAVESTPAGGNAELWRGKGHGGASGAVESTPGGKDNKERKSKGLHSC